MKKYIAPQVNYVNLRSEEKIAVNVECYIGECHLADGTPIWEEPGTSS